MNTVSPMVWVNGKRHSPDALLVSAFDRGFTLADGIFETMPVYGGSVFRLDQHLARLARSLAALQIPAPAALDHWVEEALHAVDGADATVRLTVTRGPAALGLAPTTNAESTVIVAVTLPTVFPATLYDVGLTAHIASGRRNEHAMTNGLKTLAYTDSVAAWLEAQRAGADDALFLDTEGHCSEATSSNLFVCVRGSVVTPPISCGALPGITRAAVMEFAQALGIENHERPVELNELLDADEAFLTSSLRGLAPLVRVGTHPIGNGTPGALTRRLTVAYSARVTKECGA